MSGNAREGWGDWTVRMVKLAAKVTFRATFTPFPILNQGLVRTLIGTETDPRLLQVASYALCGRVCQSWDELLVRLPMSSQQQFDTAAVRDDEVRRQQAVVVQNYRELFVSPQPISAGSSNQLGEMIMAVCSNLFEVREDGENHQDIRLRADVSEDQLKLSKALISIFVGYIVVLEKFRHKTLRQEVWNAIRSFFNNRYALIHQLSLIERETLLPILRPAFTEWLQSLKVPQEIIQEIFDPDIQTLVGPQGTSVQRVQLRRATELLLQQHYPSAYFLYAKSFQTVYQETNIPFLGWMLRLAQFLIVLLPEQLAKDQPLFMQALVGAFGKNWDQLDDFLNRLEQLMATLSQSIEYRAEGDLLYPSGLFGNDAAMIGLLKTVDNQLIIPPILGKSVHIIHLIRDILTMRRTVVSGIPARGRTDGVPAVSFGEQALVLTQKLCALSTQSAQEWSEFCERRQFTVNPQAFPLSMYTLIQETFDEKVLALLKKSPEYLAKLSITKKNYQVIIQSFAAGNLFQAEGFLLDIIDETIRKYCESQPAGSVSKLMIENYLRMNPVDKEKARQQLTPEQKKEIFGKLFAELILVEKDSKKKQQLAELQRGTELVYTEQGSNISEAHFRQLVNGLITHDDDPAFAAEIRKHCANVEVPIVNFDLKDDYHQQLTALKGLKTTRGYSKLIDTIQNMNVYFNDSEHGRRLQTTSYAGRFSYSRRDCDARMASWKMVLDNLSNYLKNPNGAKSLESVLTFLDKEIHQFRGFHIPLYGKINWFCKQDWRWEGANWILLRIRFRSLVKSFRRFTCIHSRYANHLKAVRAAFKQLVYVHEIQPQIAAKDPIQALKVFGAVSLSQLKNACPEEVAELEQEEREWEAEEEQVRQKKKTAPQVAGDVISSSSSTDSFLSAQDDSELQSTVVFPEKKHFCELGRALESISSLYTTSYNTYPKETPAVGNQLVFRVWRDEHNPTETILDTLDEVKVCQAELLQAQECGILNYWNLPSCRQVQAFDVVRLNHAPVKKVDKLTVELSP